MRGLKLTLPMIALIGLAACEEQTITIGGAVSGAPAGFKQAECLELQQKMEDMSIPVFLRNGARDDFHQKDCVYRSQDAGAGLFAPAP